MIFFVIIIGGLLSGAFAVGHRIGRHQGHAEGINAWMPGPRR